MKYKPLTRREILLIISMTTGIVCLLPALYSNGIFISSAPFAFGMGGGGGIYETVTPNIATTPNPTQIIQAVYDEVDNQFKNLLRAHIAFNKPEQMKKGDTTTVELILSPSTSESELAKQVIEQGGFATSTAQPNLFIAPDGGSATIVTGEIEITPRMKAVLKSQYPDAFLIEEMHDNAEQIVSSTDVTTWRWSVTAEKEGPQTIELIIYQLVKYEGKEFWHEVETYKAKIVVKVTTADRLKSLDWKWIGSAILIPIFVYIWGWFRNKNKNGSKEKPAHSMKNRKK